MILFLLFVLFSGTASAQTIPQSPEGYFLQAHQFEKKRDFARAEKIYQEALHVYPDNPDLLKALGGLYQEESRFQEAIEVFNRILKRAPLYPGVNFLVGVSYYGLNRYNEAIDALNKELHGNPKDRQTRYYLALGLQAAGKRVEAIQQLEALLAEDSQDSLVLYQLARQYNMAALKTSRQLASSSPDSDLLHALRGETFSNNDQNEKALEEFAQVLKKNPGFPGIHFSLGEVYWKMQENDKAVRELKLALEEDVNHTLANFYLADILIKDQKFQEAIPHLKIAADGDHRVVQGQRAHRHQRRIFAQAVAGHPGRPHPLVEDGAEAGDAGGEDRGLGVGGELQVGLRTVPAQLRDPVAEGVIGLVEGRLALRERLGQRAPHADLLRSLAREDEGDAHAMPAEEVSLRAPRARSSSSMRSLTPLE